MPCSKEVGEPAMLQFEPLDHRCYFEPKEKKYTAVQCVSRVLLWSIISRSNKVLGREVIHDNKLLCCGVKSIHSAPHVVLGAVWWSFSGHRRRCAVVCVKVWWRCAWKCCEVLATTTTLGQAGGSPGSWEHLRHHFDPHYLAWEARATPLTLIITGPGKSQRQRVGGGIRTSRSALTILWTRCSQECLLRPL